MSGKIEVFKGDNGDWFFHLKAPNGQVILASEGYTRKRNAMKGIEAVKKYAGKAAVKVLE